MIKPSYDPAKVVVPAWPAAQPAGDGWWRLEWIIEYAPDETKEVPPLPVPPPQLADAAVIVGLMPVGVGRLRLEVLSRQPDLAPLEIGYISSVLDTLRESLRPLRINGHTRNLLLQRGGE